VAPRRAVGDALRHGVRLAPDDVAAEPPASGLEGEGHAPRDAHEVLRLEALHQWRPSLVRVGLHELAYPTTQSNGRLRLLHALRDASVVPGDRIVAVAYVEPAGAVGPQHAADFLEDRDHARHVAGEVGLQAHLLVNADGPALAAEVAEVLRPLLLHVGAALAAAGRSLGLVAGLLLVVTVLFSALPGPGAIVPQSPLLQ